MDIKQLKKELDLDNKDLAEFYDMSYGVFANSTAKERYENALVNFYKRIKNIEDTEEVTISKREYEALKRDSDNLRQVDFSM